MIVFPTQTGPCGGSGGHCIHHCVISIKLQFCIFYFHLQTQKIKQRLRSKLGVHTWEIHRITDFKLSVFFLNAILFTDPCTSYCQLLQFYDWWSETSAASSGRQHKAEPTLVRCVVSCHHCCSLLLCEVSYNSSSVSALACGLSLLYSPQNLFDISFINDEKYSDPCL